jgi:hypothetical protein
MDSRLNIVVFIDLCFSLCNDNQKGFKKFSNSFFRGFENGCEAIWYITQNFQHLSVWDSEMLELQLKKTGFKNFYKQEFNQGLNKDLLIDKNGRQVESLYAEAVK